MQIDAFLQSIKPGVTLYSVLVTFAIAAFFAAKFFWNYEKQLDEENVKRVRDLMSSFQDRYVTPLLESQLTKAIDSGYDKAITDLISDLYRDITTAGGFERQLVDDEQLKHIIEIKELRQRIDKFINDLKSKEYMVGAYLSAKTGEDLLEKLDLRYDQKKSYSKHYENACSACVYTAYTFFALSTFLLIGITRVIGPWPDTLWFFWIFLTAQAFVFGVSWFLRLEYCRSKIKGLWKELQLHGTI